MISFGDGNVLFPPENRASQGGGPIRRASLPLVRSGWQMPQDGGSPTWVHRTTGGAVRDPHPGGTDWGLDKMKFLPDGRLVPADALAGTLEQLSAGDAVARLQAWYGDLSRAGNTIVATYRALGRPIPCSLRARHNAAVSEYLKAGRAVFDQLAKKGVVPVQKLLGANGAVIKELQISAPVTPLSFVTSDCKIVGVTPLDPAASALGIGPLIIVAGAAALAIVLIGAAAAARIYWYGEDPSLSSYKASVDAHSKCVQDALKAGAKPDDVLKVCPSPAAAPAAKSPLGVWGAVAIATAVLAAGGLGAYYLSQRT